MQSMKEERQRVASWLSTRDSSICNVICCKVIDRYFIDSMHDFAPPQKKKMHDFAQ
jgi:hypothetical protein